jgi:hypothetical protein
MATGKPNDPLVVYHPDGRRFLTFEELEEERAQAVRQAAEPAQRAAEADRRAAEADQRAAEAVRRAEQAVTHIASLSRKVLLQRATPEEVAELERLLKEAPGA